jgi:plastocyanin
MERVLKFKAEIEMSLALLRYLDAAKLNGAPVFAAIAAGLIAGVTAGAAFGAGPYVISQKDRQFHPGSIALKRGEILRIVNDDGELLHHAYLTTDKFSFDSGDQKPGSRYDVVFPVTGNFTILCGIHPKMRLVVDVTD